MFQRLEEMDEAWRVGPAGARLDSVRRAAQRLKERLRSGPTVRSVRTYDLVTLPYPARYGLSDATRTLLPFLMITNRTQLVTVNTAEGVKRVLVNPSDHQRDGETPFFKRLADRFRGVPLTERLMVKRHAEVPDRLREVGLRGDQIDYLTFDHLHTQDLRRLMLEWCPRARLLVQKEELAIFERLHPLQNDWYLADSLKGIPPDRFQVLDGDVLVGEGMALVRTPGHTLGNHSIVLHTSDGLWTISENGIAVDSYQPERSELSGLRGHARSRGVEVILNANTREHSLDQYTSMVLEKQLADATRDGWLQHFPSSELTPSALTPGLAPTHSHREITHGPEPA
jgi:glyoxylase-like metal-dependent hydrolase (beta-lactamase superfamily II)